MKRKITILFLVITHILPVIAGEIETKDLKLFREGERVVLSFSAYIPEKTVRSGYRLLVTPQLYNDTGSKAMELFTVTGSKMEKREKQKRLLNKDKTAGSNANSFNGTTMHYTNSIPYETWMGNALSLRLSVEEEGCCDIKSLAGIKVMSDINLPLPYTPSLSEVMPMPGEATKMANKYPFLRLVGEEGGGSRTTSVRFRVSNSTLDLSLSSNAENVKKIMEGIQLVNSDERTRLEKITITGFASPEGSARHNLELSENRAKALKQYLQREMNISESSFEVQAGGEDWIGLLELVKQSEIQYKNEIIDIITNHPADKRNERIKQLGGGRPYQSIYDVIYPQLRDACYINVWYSEKQDEAARTINNAISLIAAQRYEEALKTLSAVEGDPRSWNTIGSCHILQGDYSKARTWLKKAAEAGDKEAEKNLNSINL